MNKLYILGALALASVEGLVRFQFNTANDITLPIASIVSTAGITGLNTQGLGGTYTYAFTGDCLASGALTTLGLNNNYYQYYYVALSKGTAVHATPGQTFITDSAPTPIILLTVTNVYNGCWHMHIYNWIAMPTLATTSIVTSVTTGFGNAVVGYGYAMVGTATTACAVSTIVTATLFATATFKGAQYQGSILSLLQAGTAITIPVVIPVWGQQGPGYYATKTNTATAASTTSGAGVGLTFATSQNSYWDFMQSNTITGLTTLGRGGGLLGTGPCGWYVGYFYEAPARGISKNVDIFNVQDDAGAPTLHFWTDNSVVKAASAFVLAGLAGLLF